MPLLHCFSSLGCPEFSLDQTLALAAQFQVPTVELRALDGGIDLAGSFARTYGTPAAFGQRLAASAVKVVACNASLRLVGGTMEQREQLIQLAPWAEAAGVRWLRIFDGGSAADAAELAEAVATLTWWRETRARHDWTVNVMVETHDAWFTGAAINRFLEWAPGTAILWDAHHTWRKGGEDPVVTWRAIRPAVVHVHVKDSLSVPSAKHPFTYVLPGDGDFPIRPLLAALEADGFAGPVSLEWEKVWHPYLPPLEQALHVAGERGWW